MTRKPEETLQANVWKKNAEAIEKSGIKTIKELVVGLQPGRNTEAPITGITSDDTVAMLVNVGLAGLQLGSRFSEALREHFKGAPEKITFVTILNALDEIERNKELDTFSADQLKQILNLAQAGKIKDPFSQDTPLSDNPATAFIFKKTILDDIANALKLKASEVEKLKKHYKTPVDFIDNDNADIKKKTGIDVKNVVKFKSILRWADIEGVSISLANAFVTKQIQPLNAIKQEVRDLQQLVKKSGISVPYKEKTLKHLRQVHISVRKAMPEVAYYQDAISSLKIPAKAKKILDENEVTSFDDLRRRGLLAEVIEKGKIADQKVCKTLKAYLDHSTLSTEFDVNTKVIEKGYTHPAMIPQVTRNVFMAELREELGDFQAALYYEKALAQYNFLNSIEMGVRADAANGYKSGMNKLIDNAEAAPPCQCKDCESAVSPLAYLVDLLDYAVKHLKQADGNTVDLSYLSNNFGQPFGELPATCGTVSTQVRQARIGIEVLRKQDIPTANIPDFQKAESAYLLNAYQAILSKIGTSMQELRLAKSMDQEKREKLATKLGIELTEEDEIGRLLLSLEPGTPDNQRLTEHNLEVLFGLADTTRNELATGAKSYDPHDILTRWHFDGVQWLKNTDERGKIYLTISTTGKFSVSIYCDSERQKLVAQGQGVNSALPHGLIKLDPVNGSGLSGHVCAKAASNTIEISLIPEFVCLRLKHLRKLWKETDWPSDDYTGPERKLPIIDPDVIGPQDMRSPIASNKAFDRWKERRLWLDSQINAFTAIGSGGGSPTRSRSTNMLRKLSTTFSYGSLNILRSWPWFYRFNLEKLDILIHNLTTGTQLDETIGTIENELRLTTDSFSRLMDIRSKDESNANEPVSREEWAEFISILVQVRKKTVFQEWIREENEQSKKIELGAEDFWIAAKETEPGQWPPALDNPLIDPNLLDLITVRRSLAYPKIEGLWQQRRSQLNDMYQDKKNERESNNNYDQLLSNALNRPISELEILKNDLSSETEAAMNARHEIESQLYLNVDEEFVYLMAVKVKVDSHLMPTNDEWDRVYSILTKQEKLSQKYPAWKNEEQTKGIFYWDVVEMRLALWRASPSTRYSWQEALRNCSQLPFIDPDLIGPGDLKDALAGKIADLWDKRRNKIVRENTDLIRAVNNAPTRLAGFDLILIRSLSGSNTKNWIENEFIKNKASLDDLLCWTLRRPVSELERLYEQLQESHPIRITANATSEINKSLYLTVDTFNELMNIRKNGNPNEFYKIFKIVAHAVDVYSVMRLREEHAEGKNITAFLKQLGLTYPAFTLLVQTRDLICAGQGDKLLESEWADIRSILIQAMKTRLYSNWLREEQEPEPEPIVLSPDFFRIEASALSKPWIWEHDLSSKWRADSSDLRDWREKLQGRIKHQDAMITEINDVIDSVEEQFLPDLRSALIVALSDADIIATDPKRYENPARVLGDHFAISMEVGGCQKTTRASQAIKTVQVLLWSLRTGLLDDSIVFLDADSFDEEWKWIGSYETWRALMLVNLYPENVLLPNLRSHESKTPAFIDLVHNLKKNQMLDREQAHIYAKEYFSYIEDIANMTIDATCDVWVHVGLGIDPSAYQKKVFLFSLERSKVYWSCFDPDNESTYSQTLWDDIEGLNNVKSIVGASCYYDRVLFLFLLNNSDEFVYKSYDLTKDSWLENPAKPLEIGIDKYEILINQGRGLNTIPCFLIIDHANTNKLKGYVYCLEWNSNTNELYISTTTNLFEYNLIDTINRKIKSFYMFRGTACILEIINSYSLYARFFKDDTVNSVSFDLQIPLMGSLNNVQLICGWDSGWPDVSNRIYVVTDIHYYTGGGRRDFWICAEDDSSPIQSVDMDFGPVHNSINTINHQLDNCTWGVKGSSAYKYEPNAESLTVSVQRRVTHIAFSNLSSANLHKVMYIGPLPESEQERQQRVNFITAQVNLNQFLHQLYQLTTQTVYLHEAIYFVPLQIALCLQSSEKYEAAIDWYRSTYDYNLPKSERKIYELTDLESTTVDAFNRINDWGSDYNPHEFCTTRVQPYTRFALMSIIGCLLEYADHEFAHDTDKSVVRAENLYKKALELLELEVLNQDYGVCDDIIGMLELNIAEPQWVPVMMNIQTNLSQINDSELLKTTVKNIHKELTEQKKKFLRTRLTKARLLINEALTKQISGKFFEKILAERPVAVMAAHDRLLQNQQLKSLLEQIQSKFTSRFTSTIIKITGFEEKDLLKNTLRLSSPEAAAKPDIALQPGNTHAPSNIPPLSASTQSGSAPNFTQEFCIPPNPVLTSLRLRAETNLYKINTCRNIAGLKRELEPYEAPTDTTTGVIFLGMNDAQPNYIRTLLNPTQYRFKVLMSRAKELVQLAQQVENAFISALEKMETTAYALFKARQDEEIARATVRLHDLRIKESNDGVSLALLQQERSNIMANTYQEWIDTDLLELEEELLKSYTGLMELQLLHMAAVETYEGARLAIEIAGIGNPYAATAAAAGASAYLSTKIYAEIETLKKQREISQQTFMASHERRKQEWQLQKALADQDIQITGQQISIANDQVRIVEQEKRIAEMQANHAADTIEFLGNQFFNEEMYEWMSGILERVYRFFLQQATSIAKLAENQLSFERQEIPVKIIQSDYWEVSPENAAVETDSGNNTDRRGITGSARLLQDIYQLDQVAFETKKRKEILTQTFSLVAIAPAEFARFRETGVLQFATPMRLFDQGLPGHYHRLIRRVRIGVLALIPPIQGIRAMLTTSGISRIVVGETIFQTKEIRRLPESISFTSPSHATELVELQAEQAAEMLLPFEGMGVDTNWEFRLPKAGNRFDFSTINDILFSIDYTSLFSPIYYQQVVQQLDRRFLADHILSFKHQYPDVWYHLHNPQDGAPIQAEFEITRTSFPPNLDDIEVRELLLYISSDAKQIIDNTCITLHFTAQGAVSPIQPVEATPIDQTINTLKGNGGGWVSVRNKSPFGKWTLEFQDSPDLRNLINNNGIDDILFVISYSGDTPLWPEI